MMNCAKGWRPGTVASVNHVGRLREIKMLARTGSYDSDTPIKEGGGGSGGMWRDSYTPIRIVITS